MQPFEADGDVLEKHTGQGRENDYGVPILKRDISNTSPPSTAQGTPWKKEQKDC